MLATSSAPARGLVLATSFYTAALERPLTATLERDHANFPLTCVPYNQLHTFLFDPLSGMSVDEPSKIVLLLRVEDLIRLELVSLDRNKPDAERACSRAFQERTEQFLDILARLSLQLTVLICPSGRGAYDLKFLGNAVRVAEHKIAAELRGQERHLVISWSEFERGGMAESCFNPSGDRLGHVPFSPQGLDAISQFLCSKLASMPVTDLAKRPQDAVADLERFLTGLNVEMNTSPLTQLDEEAALNVVRHTTHFINWPTRKWSQGDISALAAAAPSGEAWTVRVRDRFGDYGVSGAVTFAVANRVFKIGLAFLTCPVLGRQVEYAFWGWIAKLAESRGAEFIEVPFVRGRDNEGLERLLTKWSGPTEISPAIGERKFRLTVAGLADQILAEAPSQASVNAIIAGMQTGAVALSA